MVVRKYLVPIILATALLFLAVVTPYHASDAFRLVSVAELNTGISLATYYSYVDSAGAVHHYIRVADSGEVYDWNFLASNTAISYVGTANTGASGYTTYLDVFPNVVHDKEIYYLGSYSKGGITEISAPFTVLHTYSDSVTYLTGLHVGSSRYIFYTSNKTLYYFDGGQSHTLYQCYQSNFSAYLFSAGRLSNGDGIFAVYLVCSPGSVSGDTCTHVGDIMFYRLRSDTTTVSLLGSVPVYAGEAQGCDNKSPHFIHVSGDDIYILYSNDDLYRYAVDLNNSSVGGARIAMVPHVLPALPVRVADPTTDYNVPGYGPSWVIPDTAATGASRPATRLLFVPYSSPGDYFTVDLPRQNYEVHVRSFPDGYLGVVYSFTSLTTVGEPPKAILSVYKFAPLPNYTISNLSATYSDNNLYITFDVTGPDVPVEYNVVLQSPSSTNITVLDSGKLTPPATYAKSFHLSLSPGDYNIIVSLSVNDNNVADNRATYTLTVSGLTGGGSSGGGTTGTGSSTGGAGGSVGSSGATSSGPASSQPSGQATSPEQSASATPRQLSTIPIPRAALFLGILVLVAIAVYYYYSARMPSPMRRR